MHPSNNLIDHFRRNPLPYIIAVLALLILFPIVLRIGFAVFSVAFAAAGATLTAVLSVLAAILLLTIRFIWVIAIMAVIWWVVNRRPSQAQPHKRKRQAAPPERLEYHYDENGDAFLYEDELFDQKRKRR